MPRAMLQSSVAKVTKPPPLENGDCLDQKTFHERYEAMPENFKAELIGGVVYVSSPQKLPHSRHWILVASWLADYEKETPGVRALINPTSILGDDSEPQPDCCLVLDPLLGGQSRVNDEEYLVGAAELHVEISAATESIDLNQKKADYERAGVKEYVVIALRTKKVFWFILRKGKFKKMAPGRDGIFRCQVFPGLWLNPKAILEDNVDLLDKVLRQGLDSPEHQAYARKLHKRQKRQDHA